MSPTRLFILTIVLLLMSISLSACGGDAFIPSGWSGFAVDQDVVYLAYNQFVYAIRITDGSQVWRYPKEGAERDKSFYAAPALTGDGQVIVGGYDHQLYSLDQKDGAEKWSFPAKDRFIASPLVTEGLIFAPNADGNLYALDFRGNSVWTFKAGSSLWATPVTDHQCTCIYLASFDHQMYSLEAKTGKLNWGPVDMGSAIVGSPALSDDGILYVGTFGKEMVALSAKNGEILWRVPTDGWVWAGPALSGDRLYFGDIDGNFYVLDVVERQILKKTKPDGPITSTPHVAQDEIYVTTESGTIYALDRDGNPIWSQLIGGKIHTSPVTTGDMILVSPVKADAILYGLNTGGAQKWAFVPTK